MKKNIISLSLLLASTFVHSKEYITFGTGEINGTYYPRGQFICDLINKYQKADNINCSVESTDGSVYNINAIKNKNFNFAISQSDTIYQALNGKKSFKNNDFKKLRSVIAIHPELLTFVVNKKSGIKTIEDIKGKRINIGNPKSGSEFSTMELFNIYNIKKTDLKMASSLKAEDTADALRDNKIDGYFFMVGHPALNIKDAADSQNISIIPIKGKKIDLFLKENSFFTKSIIPKNLYKGINKDIETLSVKAVIITSADVKEELVYNFVKIILENFEEFKSSHIVFKDLTKKSLLEGLTAPLHKGAKKYFDEIKRKKNESKRIKSKNSKR